MSKSPASIKDLAQLESGKYPNESSWDWEALLAALALRFDDSREILTEAGIHAESLRALRVFPKDEPYGRKVLFRSDRFEVMLATWASGAHCAPHNHGFSRGVVWLVEGDFLETHYELSSELKILGKPVPRPAGTLLRVTPGDLHSMVALRGGVSLHIYTPSIQEMKVYDSAQRRTLTVTDDCGAWVPENSEQIVNEEAWPPNT